MDKELEKQLAQRKLQLTKLSLETIIKRRKDKECDPDYKQVIDKIEDLKVVTPDFKN